MNNPIVSHTHTCMYVYDYYMVQRNESIYTNRQKAFKINFECTNFIYKWEHFVKMLNSYF